MGPVDPWRERIPCWSRFAGRTADPMGDPHWMSFFLKDYTHVGVHEGQSPVGGTPNWSRAKA